MAPPIKLCINGHNICSECKNRVQHCPTCKAEFSKIRNLALENIARRRKYPCRYRESGCLELFSTEHIAEHQTVCVYGEINCPLQIIGKCSWKGNKSDLKEHAKAQHANKFLESSAVRFPPMGVNLSIVSFFGNLFTYYQQIRDGRLFGAFQLIGTKSEASRYKSKFTLVAANGIEKISNIFLVRSYTEKFEAIFNSGRCLSLDVSTATIFPYGNKLNMSLELSRV
jgi:E3 ubiquitin-protein ligase SIAH1